MSMTKLRLVRIPEKGMLTGVCAGLAEHFGWNLLGVRIITVIAGISLMPVVPILYVIAAVLLPRAGEASGALRWPTGKHSAARYAATADAGMDADSYPPPSGLYGDAQHRVRELESRLRELEAYMTSSRYEFDRALKRGSPLQ